MIRVDSIAPDIAFCDVDVIPKENVILGEKIGSGGFGEVFQVWVETYLVLWHLVCSFQGTLKLPTESGGVTHEVVAIKRMLTVAEDLDNDVEMSDKFDEFQKEVYIMSYLQHPCLVRVRKHKRKEIEKEQFSVNLS